jgi:hypothetical protein
MKKTTIKTIPLPASLLKFSQQWWKQTNPKAPQPRSIEEHLRVFHKYAAMAALKN